MSADGADGSVNLSGSRRNDGFGKSYTSSKVPVTMQEDTSRAVVAGPTSLQKFWRTGGAASDVESRSRNSTAANSLFRSWEQQPRTPARAQEPAEQVPGCSSRVPDQVRQVPGGAQRVLYATLRPLVGALQVPEAVQTQLRVDRQ